MELWYRIPVLIKVGSWIEDERRNWLSYSLTKSQFLNLSVRSEASP